ncbi:GNAT family N-acetyltransferase [Azotobacter beijerinckii]|uniref:GNAT family N-acetyltransferase n=1 Tax=Azotobacter beijerinckii TaxID=170623 RepID=UPI00244EF198|nr:GNAT family N-acetyltransferase [Azotobacter beijerinckii]
MLYLLRFLVGFVLQSQPHVAYVHFVVRRAMRVRQGGHGRLLHSSFFQRAASLGCTEVQCITSPVNAGSIAFHKRMGFAIVSTGAGVNGVPVSLGASQKTDRKVR